MGPALVTPTSIRAMLDGEDRPGTRIENIRDRIVVCFDVDLASAGRLALDELLEELETIAEALDKATKAQEAAEDRADDYETLLEQFTQDVRYLAVAELSRDALARYRGEK